MRHKQTAKAWMRPAVSLDTIRFVVVLVPKGDPGAHLLPVAVGGGLCQ